ncbi:MAG TPA: hypothetical protein VK590_04740, partial [Saprospiraceae bacterium]|nr:hypothetical protein [Saprospiraceae bacterium]
LGINVSDVGPNTKINLEILNEAGENVFSDPCSTVGEGVELFQWSYCDTGYFYLVIKDSNFDNKSGGGSYNFNLQFIPKECNSTIATASKIEIGQTVKSIIKNTVDDYFSFDVTAPIVLDINLKELDDTATVTWKGLTLIDENKKVLWVHTYYKDVDLDAYYDLSICQPGKYYLEVTDNHQQSCISKKTYFAYELTLNTNKIDKYECNNDVASATTINVNENITASVDFFGDKDYYVFPILKNDSLIVDFDITEAQLLKLHLQDANHILPEMTQILKGTNGLHYSVVYPKGGFSGNYILYTEPFNSYSHDDFFYSKN